MKHKTIDSAAEAIALTETAGALPISNSFRLTKILVPVDFSNASRKTLHYAIHFAHQFQSTILLLHVLEPYVPVSGMEPIPYPKLNESAQEYLKSFQKLIPANVPSMPLLREGSSHVEITGVAKEFDVNLIIISTHGHTGLAHILLGSTAEKVVRHAHCPVLVVREHEKEFIVPGSP